MIKIYGNPRSSAGRCFVLLEELGLPYEVVPLDMRAREHKSPEFLKLNPNGKVPVLVDDDFVIWESTAINHYLCEKYGPNLLGSGPQNKGLVQQWSTWSVGELQVPLLDCVMELYFKPEGERDMGWVDRRRRDALPLLTILDRAIGSKSFLVGQEFSVADINVASVMNLALMFGVPLDGTPNLQRWLNAIKDRPSFRKFGEK